MKAAPLWTLNEPTQASLQTLIPRNGLFQYAQNLVLAGAARPGVHIILLWTLGSAATDCPSLVAWGPGASQICCNSTGLKLYLLSTAHASEAPDKFEETGSFCPAHTPYFYDSLPIPL